MRYNLNLAWIIMAVLAITLVSAGKSFDQDFGEYGKIRIKDLFFFNKADYVLEQYDCSLINCYAQGSYKLYGNEKLFDDLKFKDAFGTQGRFSEQTFYILANESYQDQEVVYDDFCQLLKNGTVANCTSSYKETRTVQKYREYWKKYTVGQTVPEGEGKWKVEMNRPINKKVDFILKAQDYDLTEWAWFNTSWTKKQQISNLTGNIISINVTYDSDMLSNFSDIRFTNTAEDTELSHYLLEKVNGAYAIFRVRITQGTIYMYYGNSVAPSASSLNNTYNTNPVAFYPMEDLSGSVLDRTFINNLSAKGSIEYNSTAKLNRAIAVKESGGSPSGNRTDIPVFTGLTSSNNTIDFWFKWNANGSGTPQDYDFYNNANPGASQAGMIVRISANQISCAVNDNAYYSGTSVNILQDANLHHITCVFGRTANAIEMWKDGAQIGNGTWDGRSLIENASVQLFSSNSGNNPTANYTLDEVLIYGRALNMQEISSLYNVTTPVPIYGAEQSLLPVITIYSPANNTAFITGQNVTFIAGLNSPEPYGVTNVSLIINGVYNQTNSSVANGTNYTFSKPFSVGTFGWIIEACSLGNCVNSSNRTFSFGEISNNGAVYEGFVFDTQTKAFGINISTGNTVSTISAILEYNNTNYTMNNIGTVNAAFFNVSFDVPLVYTAAALNKTFKYYVTTFSSVSGTTTRDYSGYYQIINATNFSICDTNLVTKFLNISFQNEVNSTMLAASVPTATFIYYLGSGSSYKTLTYASTSNSFNYTFCASPNNQTLQVEPYVQYKAGTAYPQRIWQPTVQSYAFNDYNQTLLLLNSADGLFVTFQAIDSAQFPIDGVDITAESISGSTYTTVAQGTTGSDGAVTFWLNPDFQHRVNASKTGYESQSVTITPTQDGYTFNLGSGVTATSYDYFKGITYSTKPTVTYLSNGTTYSFNLSISSSFWNLSVYGFNITNQNGVTYGAAYGTTGTGSTVNANVATGTNTTFCMNYFWTINSTNSSASRCWLIINTAGNTYSIAHGFSHLVSYIALGFWGIGEFEIGIICFVLIVMTTGTLKLKYGISDEAVLCGVIFGCVAILDVSLGLIPNPINAVDHFPTVIMALIFVGLITKEAFQ